MVNVMKKGIVPNMEEYFGKVCVLSDGEKVTQRVVRNRRQVEIPKGYRYNLDVEKLPSENVSVLVLQKSAKKIEALKEVDLVNPRLTKYTSNGFTEWRLSADDIVEL